MRRIILTALIAVVPLVQAASALADADPASDVLAGQDVFLPYAPPASDDARARITSTVAAAIGQWQPIKVAVIGGAADLGSVTQFVNQPKGYAAFLGTELTDLYGIDLPLLVVMPNGYATHGAWSPAATKALEAVEAPGTNDTSTLATKAADAVVAMAKADGKDLQLTVPVPSPSSSVTTSDAGGGGEGDTSRVALLLAVAGVLAIAGLALIGWTFLRPGRVAQIPVEEDGDGNVD